MKKTVYGLAFLGIAMASHSALASSDDCSDAALKAVQQTAAEAARANRLPEAIALLEKKTAQCVEMNKPIDFWLRSDLGLYYWKNKQFSTCALMLAPLTWPTSQLQAEDGSADKVNKAIEFNFNKCRQAYGQAMGFTKLSRECPLKLAPDIFAAIAVPAGFLNPEPSQACVGLQRTSQNLDAGQTDACPRLVKLVAEDKSATKITPIAVIPGGPSLVSESDCCNITQLELGISKGKNLIRFTGSGRDCQGGTASMEYDEYYIFQPGISQKVGDLNLGFH